MISLKNQRSKVFLVSSNIVILLLFLFCMFFVSGNETLFSLNRVQSRTLLFSILILGLLDNAMVLVFAKQKIVFGITMLLYILMVFPWFVG